MAKLVKVASPVAGMVAICEMPIIGGLMTMQPLAIW
jgi:copper(I)-binding protein